MIFKSSKVFVSSGGTMSSKEIKFSGITGVSSKSFSLRDISFNEIRFSGISGVSSKINGVSDRWLSEVGSNDPSSIKNYH